MKVKAIIPVSKDGKIYKVSASLDVNEAEAQNLAKAGAVVITEATAQQSDLPPLTIEELADMLFAKHGEFTEKDFRKDSKLPKADAVRRVLEREDVSGELLEKALELLEAKLKG